MSRLLQPSKVEKIKKCCRMIIREEEIEEYIKFRHRVAEAGGFDVEHLMKAKPKCFRLVCVDSDFSSHVFLYAKLGIHKYNMLQGTNLQLSCIEKYNARYDVVYAAYYITLVAKDPAAGGSLVTFQTKVVDEFYKGKTLTVDIARLKSQPEEEPKGPVDDCHQLRLPDEWPSENAFNDKKRYYVMKKSELRKYDWVRLYMEFAFLLANTDLTNPRPNLSNLVIIKVAVETEENVEPRLNARNALFYIRYRYYPNRGLVPKGHAHRSPRDRIAIVKRTMDMNTGLLKLEIDGRYVKTLL